MAEPITALLVLMGVIAVSTVVFAAWVVLSIVRWVFRGVFGILGVGHQRPPALPHRTFGSHRCSRPGCQTINPSAARFCRRCGRELDNQMVMRRAAVW